MRWRMILEVVGADGTRQVHEVGAGGRSPAGHTAATLGLGLEEGKAVLAAVQRRRRPPAVVVQSAQAVLHRVVFERAFAGQLRNGPPLLPVLLARYVPPSRGLYARGIAFGPLPEHAPGWARR